MHAGLRRVGLAWLLAAGWVAASAQDEVPFITTPDKVTLAMLELAQVQAQDRLLDLGSGDGRIVITAARLFGAKGLGVEIVPEMVLKSQALARAAGVQQRVEFRQQDLFLTDLAGATVVTLYLLPEVNLQLRPRLLALPAGTRIVSHDWDMGEWTPDRSLTLEVPDKAIGRDKRSTVHLWLVPARVQGSWCSGALSLDISQRFQRFSATLSAPGLAAPVMVFDGHIQAARLQASGPLGDLRAELAMEGSALRLHRLSPPGSAYAGRLFNRAGPAGCTR